ncbi:MAG TPA: polysaccharide biosynthesis tyrosine autokinase [Pirellulales bacterium]|nr:polysaccharide biosynthesis tyrosine autokinase [Pirellulales bacterium]
MQTPRLSDAADSTMRTNLVHSVWYFLRVVRLRRGVMAACIVVSLLLGALYYATAHRRYESRASLLVLQAGNDVASTSMSTENAGQGLMPTYERLMTSAVVLQAALNRLPYEDRIDFDETPQERWIELLQTQLRAVAIRRTNIIELSYESKRPETAVAVVNAVVQAYLEFMDTTHKGTAGQLISVLTKEKSQVEEKLESKQAELLAARRQSGDLGMKSDGTVTHPIIQRAISVNEEIIKTQQRRIELQGLLVSVEAAVKAGQSLEPHLMSLDNGAGRELILSDLGLSGRDATMQAELEKSMLDDRAKLRTLQEHLGPNHPDVQEITQRIQLTEQYLAGYSGHVQDRLAALKDKQLAPMLLQLVRQKLAETTAQENYLRQSFAEAQAEAVRLNGDLAQIEILDHDVKWMRNLRDVLLNQIANIDLRQDQGEIRTAVVSEPAVEPAIWPNGKRIALMSLLAGTLFGLGVVYVLDVLDDRFRSPQEMQLHLGVPILAIVRPTEGLPATGLRAIQAYVAPNAPKSEAFRTLRTALAFSGKESQRLVISSAEPGDGKTTMLSNLGVSYAYSGKKTLLIDADMRRPGLTRLMEMRGRPGLSELLSSSDPVIERARQLITPSGIESLDILPSGNWSAQAAELLLGNRFKELLAWAEANYQQILVDSPPILATSDAATISQLVDGVVLVVQPGKNQRRSVIRAAEGFTSLGATVLGVVVNCAGSEEEQGNYGYGYGYEYNGEEIATDGVDSESPEATADDYTSKAA